MPHRRKACRAHARSALVALSLAALSLACVRRGEYDAVVADLHAARDEAHTSSLEAEQLRAAARRVELGAQKDRAEAMELRTKNAELAHNVEDLGLMNNELVNRLRGAG